MTHYPICLRRISLNAFGEICTINIAVALMHQQEVFDLQGRKVLIKYAESKVIKFHCRRNIVDSMQQTVNNISPHKDSNRKRVLNLN